MPHQATAPAEADALRRLTQAIAHARIPAALKFLLLFLAAAMSSRAPRRARTDWYPSPALDADAGPDSASHPHALRAVRRIRAWIGWILRGLPALGMALSGARALSPCPTRTARAPPPCPGCTRIAPNPAPSTASGGDGARLETKQSPIAPAARPRG